MAPSHTDDGGRLTENGIDMSTVLNDLSDYRNADHVEVVAETEDSLVLRDDAGYELNEWADALGMSRSDLSERMHSLARDHYGRSETPHGGDPWSASDPVVLAKLNECVEESR